MNSGLNEEKKLVKIEEGEPIFELIVDKNFKSIEKIKYEEEVDEGL